MLVQTVSRKSASCETRSRVLGYEDRYSPNHNVASRSRWFVGS